MNWIYVKKLKCYGLNLHSFSQLLLHHLNLTWHKTACFSLHFSSHCHCGTATQKKCRVKRSLRVISFLFHPLIDLRLLLSIQRCVQKFFERGGGVWFGCDCFSIDGIFFLKPLENWKNSQKGAGGALTPLNKPLCPSTFTFYFIHTFEGTASVLILYGQQQTKKNCVLTFLKRSLPAFIFFLILFLLLLLFIASLLVAIIQYLWWFLFV